jgi:two-component system, response regulator, stage 0 sporulation protein F
VRSAKRSPVILIVEDDDDIRSALHRFFSDEGYLTFEAPNRAKALQVLTMLRPDLVTLDLSLPDGSGADILQQIRDSSDLTTTKVVIMSANRVIPLSIRELADAVVTKPFDLDPLLSLVERLIASGPAVE